MTERIEKKWGSEEIIVNADYCGKVMRLKAGFRCSTHRHLVKDETFYMLSGHMLLETFWDDGKLYRSLHMRAGDTYRILPGQWHRFTGYQDSVFIEFSTHDSPGDCQRKTESGPV
jgi:mannose-6-phosphate isomerase-like protein (cupin superfamily)